jgi:uncharacterized protein (DUF1697 family)
MLRNRRAFADTDAMGTWVALLRGVNVGGKNALPMKDWARDLEQLKFTNVRTYIQSGNAVFDSSQRSAKSLATQIAQSLERRRGLRVEALVLSARQLAAIMDANPFPEAVTEPRTLHVYLLAAAPQQPKLAALEALRAANERCHLGPAAFYLHAPDGIGRSRLAAAVERHLGVPVTARNWNTMSSLSEMAFRG